MRIKIAAASSENQFVWPVKDWHGTVKDLIIIRMEIWNHLNTIKTSSRNLVSGITDV